MLHKIREAMGNNKDDDDDNDGFMNTIIEIDEVYLGGKATNKHMSERVAAKGKFKKDVVLGILERAKKIKAFNTFITICREYRNNIYFRLSIFNENLLIKMFKIRYKHIPQKPTINSV